MKRIIFKIPTGLTIDHLSQEQQAAIQSVFAQYVLPMQGTISYGTDVTTITAPATFVDGIEVHGVIETFTGHSILDAVTADNFNQDALGSLGLPFAILGMWQWDGKGEMLNLVPLDASFSNYLPETHTYDEVGNILTTTAPLLHESSRWAGWPEIVL